MKVAITVNWNNFIQADVPMEVREKIIESLRWVDGAHIGVSVQDLIAQRMINIYLMGAQQGIKIARADFRAVLDRFDKGGK